MHPYRINAKNNNIIVYKRNVFFKIIRHILFNILLYFKGTFKKRYPIKCPCGKRSWDPDKNTTEVKTLQNFRLVYKCGKYHDNSFELYLQKCYKR